MVECPKFTYNSNNPKRTKIHIALRNFYFNVVKIQEALIKGSCDLSRTVIRKTFSLMNSEIVEYLCVWGFFFFVIDKNAKRTVDIFSLNDSKNLITLVDENSEKKNIVRLNFCKTSLKHIMPRFAEFY